MNRRRTAVAVLSLSAAALAVAAPAMGQANTAGTPETFAASGEATALDLQVFGNGITLGSAASSLGSDPKAGAHGVGALLPGGLPVTDKVAEVTADGQTNGSAEEACGPITLPADFPVVSLATACASAVAAIAGGLPTSASTAEVASAGVGVGEVLAQTPLGGAVTQINQTLGGILGGAPLPVDSLVSDLLTALNSSGDIVSVDLGPASTTTSAAADKVVTSSSAQGAVVELVHREALDPMVIVEIGAATATATLPRGAAAAAATGTFDPALVRITVAPDVALALGLDQNVIELAPGQSTCLPLPEPLTSCISVGHGSVTEIEGGVTATASGVALDLLTGLPEGGITLDLATATATVTGSAAVPATTLPPATVPELPRTGGAPVSPLVGVGLLGAAVAGLAITRRAGLQRPEAK